MSDIERRENKRRYKDLVKNQEIATEYNKTHSPKPWRTFFVDFCSLFSDRYRYGSYTNDRGEVHPQYLYLIKNKEIAEAKKMSDIERENIERVIERGYKDLIKDQEMIMENSKTRIPRPWRTFFVDSWKLLFGRDK